MWMRAAAAGLIARALSSAVPLGASAKPVTPREIERIVRLADPRFSPDGKTIAAVETRPDLESDEFRSEIVLVGVADHRLRPLTRTRHHAGSPRWSPRSAPRSTQRASAGNCFWSTMVRPMAHGRRSRPSKRPT